MRKNVPFRQAHSIVGKAVAYCIEQAKELTDLTLEELQGFSDVIEEDVYGMLSTEGSVNSRNIPGATAADQVETALEKAESDLGMG